MAMLSAVGRDMKHNASSLGMLLKYAKLHQEEHRTDADKFSPDGEFFTANSSCGPALAIKFRADIAYFVKRLFANFSH